jgi:hypothetical protein
MDVTSALRPRKLKKSARERRRNGAGARKGVASRESGKGTSTAAGRDLITTSGAAAVPKVMTRERRKNPLA